MTVRVEGLSQAPAAPLQLRGRALLAARLVWGAVIATSMGLFVLSVPARYGELSRPPADVLASLSRAGLSPHLYAGYLTALGCVSALVDVTVAALIVRYRPNDRIGLLASLYLVLSLGGPPSMQAVLHAYAALALPANLVFFLYIAVLVAFFFLFPDGRVVPRRARLPGAAFGAAAVVLFFATGASVVETQPDWLGMIIATGGITGIAAQVYRYLRVSDAVQRQQTKWVVLGVSAAMVVSIVFSFFGQSIPTVGRPETGYDLTGVTVLTAAFLVIPLTLGFAILRYRLWEIDVVINRALVYGALTVGLAGFYLLVAGGLGALTRTSGNLLLSLLATALVAVLFAPLRARLQTGINRLMYGERDDPYRVLTRLGERFGGALAPEGLLPAIADTVAHAMKSPHAAIILRPADVPALDSTALRLPLDYGGETVGELLVAPRGPGETFSPRDVRLLQDLARQIGPAAHAARLTADLQRSRERLVTAREEERRRLRRDLHDGLGPQLAALTLKIETIRNRFAADRDLDAALVELTARTGAALADIRRLVYGLRPPALDELGLLSAIHAAAAQYSLPGERGLDVTVDAPPSVPALPAAVEVAAYRIVEEALANVVRHSGARRCRVCLSLEGDLLRLQIVDDGRGLPTHHRTGVGMVSMRERAEELGGSCAIDSPPSGGATVSVELPCTPAGEGPHMAEEGSNGIDTHPHSR